MNLSEEQTKLLSSEDNLRKLSELTALVKQDATAGGIFPNNSIDLKDFSNPNIQAFKEKYCSWWWLAKKLFKLVKIFVGSKVDALIDALISLGDNVCERKE